MLGNRSIMNDDIEERLAQSLRDVCTPYGDEKGTEMIKSSLFILTYGNLYLARAELTLGIEKKMNYVKSAVLLRAAKARYEMNPVPRWGEEATMSIESLHESLVKSCKGHRPKILDETPDNVKKRLKLLRDNHEVELSKIELIKKHFSKEEVCTWQKEKIEMIECLLRKNATDYTVLMYYIAGKCIDILGDEPCKFAIVGLGSLARKEVTLYSDFQYVILLEEGVQHLDHYETILEYFRWFAVLFQVMIIGLGETVIQSVGVKSLNDFSDYTKDWFYDSYDRSGVAIDGMMPLVYHDPYAKHSGKTESDPLQLIHPVSRMISLLRVRDDSGNRYHLRNLLRQSCFVYGSKDLFQEFSEGVNQEVRGGRIMQSEMSHLVKYTSDIIMRVSPFLLVGVFLLDTESFLYRPISTCLDYIRSFFGWSCSSGFDVITKLKTLSHDLGVICGESSNCHHMEFALAVACELRMRVYGIENGSRLKAVKGDILRFMDKRSLQICVQQVWNLSRHLESINLYAVNRVVPDLRFSRILLNEQLSMEDSLKELLNILKNDRNISAYDETIILHQCIRFAATSFGEYRLTGSTNHSLIERAKNYVLAHPGYARNNIASGLVISIYLEQKNYHEALKVCENITSYWGDEPPKDALIIRKYHASAMTRCRSKEAAMKYCDNALKTYQDIAGILVFSLAKANGNNDRDIARRGVKSLVKFALARGTKENDLRPVLLYLEDVFLVQYANKWFKDGIETLELGMLLASSKVQFVSVLEIPHFVGRDAVTCYLQTITKYTTGDCAKRIVQKCLFICEMVTIRDDCQGGFVGSVKFFSEFWRKQSYFGQRVIAEFMACIPNEKKLLPVFFKILRYLQNECSEAESGPKSTER